MLQRMSRSTLGTVPGTGPPHGTSRFATAKEAVPRATSVHKSFHPLRGAWHRPPGARHVDPRPEATLHIEVRAIGRSTADPAPDTVPPHGTSRFQTGTPPFRVRLQRVSRFTLGAVPGTGAPEGTRGFGTGTPAFRSQATMRLASISRLPLRNAGSARVVGPASTQ